VGNLRVGPDFMNRLQQILAGSCVVCLLIFLSPRGLGQGGPVTAKAKADFMKGQLLKVEKVSDIGKNAESGLSADDPRRSAAIFCT